jgi:hypothetical protein
VEISFKLWIAGIGVGLVGVVVGLLFMDALLDSALRKDGLTAEDVGQDALRGGFIGAQIFVLFLLALWGWFVSQMRKGKNWARITITVLVVLDVVLRLSGAVTSFAGGGVGVMMGLLQVISWCLTIPAVVFMFRPDANEFFARQKQ